MTADDVRKMLKRACEKAGSNRAWAAANDVTAAYVSDVLLGRREPGPSICAALGVERVVVQTVDYKQLSKRVSKKK